MSLSILSFACFDIHVHIKYIRSMRRLYERNITEILCIRHVYSVKSRDKIFLLGKGKTKSIYTGMYEAYD